MSQVQPAHYAGFSNGATVIDIAERLNFNRGNVVKYVSRAGRKEFVDTITDLMKANWYLLQEIERIVLDNKEVKNDDALLDELSKLHDKMCGIIKMVAGPEKGLADE